MFLIVKELPDILQDTCGIENTKIPADDDGIAYAYPSPDTNKFENSVALMSGPKFIDSNTNCRLRFWYFYYSEDKEASPLIPSIRQTWREETSLDYLGPTGEAGWKQADIGLGRQYYQFQVLLMKWKR